MAKRKTQLDHAIEKIDNDILDLEAEITILTHARARLVQHQEDDLARPPRRQFQPANMKPATVADEENG